MKIQDTNLNHKNNCIYRQSKNYLFKEKKVIIMSKGIAINTILYLLLGVVVVGIIVYLVYTYAAGTQLSQQECRSRVITWCTGCSVAGWESVGSIGSTSDVGKCILDYFPSGEFGVEGNYPVDCKEATAGGDSTETFCSAFI